MTGGMAKHWIIPREEEKRKVMVRAVYRVGSLNTGVAKRKL